MLPSQFTRKHWDTYNDTQRNKQLSHYTPVLGLFPARTREISNPRLKAWLNMSRVWKVDTNGNHDDNAMGMNISIPIPASYRRAMERMDFHKPSFFIKGFQAIAIWNSSDRLTYKWEDGDINLFLKYFSQATLYQKNHFMQNRKT